ncbi:aldehyde dehydrogenase [Gloeopeniophorella convolvens]|nr:aldehyde dehydrogenase [Gloeopeniophorella convolvens]
MSNAPFASLFINGEHRPASTGATFTVKSPHTGIVASTAAAVTSDDCRAAIEAAQRAFPAWEATAHVQRQEIFLRAVAKFQDKEWQKKVSDAMRTEVAMPESHILFNIFSSIRSTQGISAMVGGLKGETFPSTIPGGQVFVQKRAHGVIYSIVPWNAPVALMIRAVAIPIICGNTVVVRPSEFTPYTSALVVDALHEAGLPAGVLNFVPMSAEDTPKLTAEIIAHPYVRKITFTGSDRVGKLIAAEAAKHLKPCVLELGGKAPSVVLADADIDLAARAIVHGALLFSGQICMSTERVIVQRPVLDALVAAVKKHTNSLSVGNPEQAHLSSLFTDRSADGILGMLQEARDAGAELLLGDGKKAGPALLHPHIVTNVKPDTRLWQRETFGPFMVFAAVDTIDEAVELANASDYSLSAALWTRDVYNAVNVAMRIHSGAVNINGSTIHGETGMGLAGLGGSSGYGRFDVDNFTDKRIVTLHPEKSSWPLLGL